MWSFEVMTNLWHVMLATDTLETSYMLVKFKTYAKNVINLDYIRYVLCFPKFVSVKWVIGVLLECLWLSHKGWDIFQRHAYF